MSIFRCEGCGRQVDSDDADFSVDEFDNFYCVRCPMPDEGLPVPTPGNVTEQAEAALADLAGLVAVFYNALINEGVDEELTHDLVRDHVQRIFTGVTGTIGEEKHDD